jgi:hypothetical protein
LANGWNVPGAKREAAGVFDKALPRPIHVTRDMRDAEIDSRDLPRRIEIVPVKPPPLEPKSRPN